MPWVKIDDHLPEHPKMQRAGPLGLAMYVAGLCYSNRNLTDGFIPWSTAMSLLPWTFLGKPDPNDPTNSQVWEVSITSNYAGEDVTCELVAARLVDAGLWEFVEGGYQIHDYGEYQPSRAEVIEKREQTRSRVKNFRASRAASNGHVASLLPESNTAVTLPPVPVPVPVPDLELQTTTTLSGKPDATAKEPAAAKRMAGPEGEILRAFDKGHRETLGVPYLAAFSRDTQVLKNPLKVYGLPLMLDFVEAFWLETGKARERPDDPTYAAGKAKPNIPGLVGQIPNLLRRYTFDSRPPAGGENNGPRS